MAKTEIASYHLDEHEVFQELCRIVMQNRLVCLTGCGISKGLTLKNGKEAPDWQGLLEIIYEERKDKLDDEQKQDIVSLLKLDVKDDEKGKHQPTGEELIEAATILKNTDEEKFNETFKESVNLKEDVYSETHCRLLELMPRGIITYNYDNAHENSINKEREKWKLLHPDEEEKEEWKILCPDKERPIKEIITNGFQQKFVLKAHGSVSDIEHMVLTRDSYRNLFAKCPVYKAFLQNIFTSYQLLIVGFGFSDPDFDLLIKGIFSTYGSPIQKHIVIKHISQKSSVDTLYKLRYGMNFLYVNDFEDIPMLLEECVKDGGKYIDNLITRCLNDKVEERSKVHKEIRNLSSVGKRCLAEKLKKKIEKLLEKEEDPGYNDSSKLSELVYSFGLLLDIDKTYKKFLIETVIEKSKDSEPVAHALVTITSHLTLEDMGQIQKWIVQFEKPFREDLKNPDPHNRCKIYAEYLRVYVEAKYEKH